MIKRSFFARGRERVALDNVIEAMKGVYTSIRLCDVSKFFFFHIVPTDKCTAQAFYCWRKQHWFGYQR